MLSDVSVTEIQNWQSNRMCVYIIYKTLYIYIYIYIYFVYLFIYL